MAYEVVLGRSEKDKEKYGTKGCVLLGKHYVKMGQSSSLSNEVWMDVSRSHVVFLCGKRGSGKSYSLGVMAEGIADLPGPVAKNIAVLIFDTMGIYWTMKYANQRDRGLLDMWGIQPKGLEIELFIPQGKFTKMVEAGIPADKPFAIAPNELGPSDWLSVFDIDPVSPSGSLFEEVISKLQDEGSVYGLQDIIDGIDAADAAKDTKRSIKNLMEAAKGWGLFSEKATPIRELVSPGKVSVLDVSIYANTGGSWNLRALVIGLVSQKLFEERMEARKKEEREALEAEMSYQQYSENPDPVVWCLVDEAHEFLPRTGSTPATNALVTILREGRQPGISLVLATQQPGKIHTDVMTQSDIIISHRITAKVDTDALGMLTQSYMRGDLDVLLNELPREKGAAIVLDDNNEKLYSMRVRPRITWHGGSDPNALRDDKQI